jgi:hypothetical protein
MDKRWLMISAGVATSAIIAYQLIRDDSHLRRRIKDYLNPYVKVGIVSELYLYPLKSGCAKKVYVDDINDSCCLIRWMSLNVRQLDRN